MDTNDQQTVNRWYTPVQLQLTIRDRIRHVKWFRDFQEAYLYANRFVDQRVSQGEEGWYIHSFEYAADKLEEYWYGTKEGLILATQRITQTTIQIYYEPEEAANMYSILSLQRQLESLQ